MPSTELKRTAATTSPDRVAKDAPDAETGFSRAAGAILAACVTVGAIAYAASVVLFSAQNGGTLAQLGRVLTYFGYSCVIGTILLIALAALGMLRTWWLAAIAGFVAYALGAVFAQAFIYTTSGQSLTPEIWGLLLITVLLTHLLPALVFTVLTPVLGRRIWLRMLGDAPAAASATRTPHRVAGTDSPLGSRRVALVRVPSTRIAEGAVSFIEREPVDSARADSQWEAYVSALDAEGFETVEVAEIDESADGVFIEDSLVIVGSRAIVTRSGAEARRVEAEGAEQAAKDLGFTISRITSPGTLDGGDVLQVGDTVFVGASTRTNAEGIRQLRAILAGQRRVIAVPITRALHLKTVMSALPDGTIVAWADALDTPTLLPGFVPVPEALGAALSPLDAETVLMSASAPQTIEMVKALGYRVVAVDISEFEKIEGGVTCLSVIASGISR